jgi:hypothetical protein
MQLCRSISVNQVNEYEKYTVGGWKLIYVFRKNLDITKLDALKANGEVCEENDQFTKLKFSCCLKVPIRSS